MSFEYLSFSVNVILFLLLLYIRAEIKRLDEKLCYFLKKLEKLEETICKELRREEK